MGRSRIDKTAPALRPHCRRYAGLVARTAAGLAFVLCVVACGSVTRTVTSSGDPGDRPGARSCGVERWAVKIAADPAAGLINDAPLASSIAQLTRLPVPRPEPTFRLAGVETSVWAIRAVVMAIKEEADRDYHLALSDGAGHTMIAESPEPACAAGSRFLAQLRLVRAALDRACPGVSARYRRVRVTADLTGVGFFDRIHGQLGVAPNGVELHPLLAVSLRGKC